MAIITAARQNEAAIAGQLVSEMSLEDLKATLLFLIGSHVRLVVLLAPYLESTPDEMYQAMAKESFT